MSAPVRDTWAISGRVTVFLIIVAVVFVASVVSPELDDAAARSSKSTSPRTLQIGGKPYRAVVSPPRGVSDASLDAGVRSPAAFGDATVLAEFTFDGGNPEGWISVDLTVPTDTFFHIDGSAGALTGGTFGRLLPLEGNNSLWCGIDGGSLSTPPGYGNDWLDQFESVPFAVTGNVTIFYKVAWDTEPGYDYGYFEYEDVSTGWTALRTYNGIGQDLEILFIPALNHGGTLRLRFRFSSDGAWSDGDGFHDTDGALLVDSLTISDGGGQVDFQNFESEAIGALSTADGDWHAMYRPGFGDYAALHEGFTVLQEDRCTGNASTFWGFFDDPATTNYACGNQPEQGAVPFGPSALGFYIDNQIWSPAIAMTGVGNDVRLQFDVYRDLPGPQSVFYRWAVRSWVGGVPGAWKDDGYIRYGDDKDWYSADFDMGTLIEPGADSIQVALGVIDLSSSFGGGTCHSQSPLFDNVRVVRIDNTGPVWSVSDEHLFQDNFAEDGTATGFVRLDMAMEIPSPILDPGDSIVVEVADAQNELGTDGTHGGPAVYCYVRVISDTVKAGTAIEGGSAYPWVADAGIAGDTWGQFRMAQVRDGGGQLVPNRFCFDLADSLTFTPGDSVFYFFGAENTLGQWTYWSRLGGTTDQIAQAASTPMEMTCLPANALGGKTRILYIDDYDQLGAQPYFDEAFSALGIYPDRYDVLAPSVGLLNGPASRISNVVTQVLPYYDVIIWNSGDLTAGLIASADSSRCDDYGLLAAFLDLATTDVGVYISGDNIAEEWSTGTGGNTGALQNFMDFSLFAGDHNYLVGATATPSVTGTPGSIFDHAGTTDTWLSAGDCPVPAQFDVLTPNLPATTAAFYDVSVTYGAVLTQETVNLQGDTARVVLSGASFHKIRDFDTGVPARIEHLRDILGWFGQGITYSPSCSIDPAAIDFGPVAVGAHVDSMFTITNTGVSTLSGTVSSTCGHYSIVSGAVYNLGPGEVDTVTVRYSPPAKARHECTIETGLGECADVLCSGSGAYNSVCIVTPDTLFFGTVVVGDSVDAVITIQNDGYGVLVDSAIVSCNHYSVVGGEVFQIEPQESLQVTMRFKPTTEGNHNCQVDWANLMLPCSDVYCVGTAVTSPCVIHPSALDFGAVNVGSAKDTMFTIRNVGSTGTLSGVVSEACGAYSILSGAGPYSLAFGESLLVSVRFAPTTADTQLCTIETGDAACNDVFITGVGDPGVTTPRCVLSPSNFNFGRVGVGSVRDTTFTITNAGGDTLSGYVTEVWPFYSVTTGGGAFSLANGESLFVGIQYAPTSVGIHRGIIELGSFECDRLVLVADHVEGLQIVDVKDPSIPTLIGVYDTPGNAQDVVASGNHAYVADGWSGLLIIDISDPTNPVPAGADSADYAGGVAVYGGHAYVAAAVSGLRVIDIGDPHNPTFAGVYDTPVEAIRVAISGTYAYVADLTGGLQIIDVADPSNPTFAANIPAADEVRDVTVSGNYAYLTDGTAGLQVIDVVDPPNPVSVGTFDTPGGSMSVFLKGGYAYVADFESGVQVIDISDPASPSLVGGYDTVGQAVSVVVDGDFAYVADGNSGLHVFDVFEPSNPDSVGSYDTPGNAQDVFVVPGGDVACTGLAGYESAFIDSIVDVPGDQGGQVRIHMTRSIYDFVDEAQHPIVMYTIYRRVDASAAAAIADSPGKKSEAGRPAKASIALDRSKMPDWPITERDGRLFVTPTPELIANGFPPGTWEIVYGFGPTQQQNYVAVVPTLADSTASGIPYSVHLVTAHTTTPAIWFASPVDSGYSLDNIAPGVPQSFAVGYNTGGGNHLTWDASTEPDFQYYRIYRGTEEDFTPDTTNVVLETTVPTWTDPDHDGPGVHYKVTAIDDAGNESDPAAPGTVTSVDAPVVPKAFALYQNVPNPFNPATVIRYDVPRGGGRVTLRIYDVAGRLVRTLVDGPQTEGVKRASWDGSDNRGSRVATGVYFYRMTAPGFTGTRKMVLLK